MGIEPTPSAWKAEVLPLNYTRKSQWQYPNHRLQPARSFADLTVACMHPWWRG
jgi:hypothetical protein